MSRCFSQPSARGNCWRGKFLGIGLLGLFQFVVAVLGALVLIRVTGAFELPAIPVDSAVTLVIWFVLGYSLFSVAFGTAGASVSRMEDAQSAAFPISIGAVLGFFAAFTVLDDPGGILGVVLSIVPFTAPFQVGRMLARMGYQHVELEVDGAVGWVWLNRPEKHNALSADMWTDIPKAVSELTGDERVRCLVVAGRGPSFTAGIDLSMLSSFASEDASPAARSRRLRDDILRFQNTMTAFERARVPVIAAVHGWCLGAGIDLVTACDIRFSEEEATFGVRETPMGLVADVGTVQRLPRIIGPAHTAELLFTGRDFDPWEAERVGLVNRVVDDVHSHAATVAAEIAANSPLVVQGAKEVLRLQQGMSTEAALDHMALWNAAFLVSNDLTEAMTAHFENRPPDFTGT